MRAPYFLHLDAAGKSMICKAEGQTNLGAVSMLCEDVGVHLLGSETELRTLLSTVLLRGVEVAGWHGAAVQCADKGSRFWIPYFLTLRSCRELDDLQRERANAFTVGAVSMLCEDVGVQLLGSKTELRRLLSTMLFGDAAAVYHAGAVQLHFGRVAQ